MEPTSDGHVVAADGRPVRTRSAEIVAEIEQEIVERGWPVGELLGSEAALMERFHVSRAVLREAIRTLERAGVVDVRSGRHGGLVVGAPRADTVLGAASLYLDYVGVGPRALYQAWLGVEGAVIDLVIRVATDDELAGLEALQRDEARRGTEGLERSRFHRELAHLCANPVLELLLLVVMDLVNVHGRDPDERSARWFARQHGALVELLVARDAVGARAQLGRYVARLEATDSVLARRRLRPDPPGPAPEW